MCSRLPIQKPPPSDADKFGASLDIDGFEFCRPHRVRPVSGILLERAGEIGPAPTPVAVDCTCFDECSVDDILDQAHHAGELRSNISRCAAWCRFEVSRIHEVDFINTTATNKRILLVENDPAFRRLVVEFLNSTFDIDVAHTGTQAAELAVSNPPDIAIVDMHLPGIGGAALIRMMRANSDLADIPILVMSVDTSLENVFSAIDAGSDEFLRKMDISKQTLVEAIDRISVKRDSIAVLDRAASVAAELVVDQRPAQLEEWIREIRDYYDYAPNDAQAKTEDLLREAVTILRSERP